MMQEKLQSSYFSTPNVDRFFENQVASLPSTFSSSLILFDFHHFEVIMLIVQVKQNFRWLNTYILGHFQSSRIAID